MIFTKFKRKLNASECYDQRLTFWGSFGLFGSSDTPVHRHLYVLLVVKKLLNENACEKFITHDARRMVTAVRKVWNSLPKISEKGYFVDSFPRNVSSFVARNSDQENRDPEKCETECKLLDIIPVFDALVKSNFLFFFFFSLRKKERRGEKKYRRSRMMNSVWKKSRKILLVKVLLKSSSHAASSVVTLTSDYITSTREEIRISKLLRIHKW